MSYLLIIIFLLIIILLIGYLILLLLPSDENIIYIIENTIYYLPLPNNVQIKLKNIILNYVMYIRNYKKCNNKNNIIINNTEKKKDIKIYIPNEIDLWEDKINYCTSKKGKIKNINYNDLVLPSKTNIVLY